MKSLLVVLAVLGTTPSYAASKVTHVPTKIEVDCKPPRMLTGGATVTGTLTLKKSSQVPQGAFMAKGSLDILIGGSTQHNVLKETVEVVGQYDQMHDVEYAHVGGTAANGNDVVVYINLSDKDLSYVEYKGTQYRSNCKEDE